ncbi:hypothetical protein ABK040_000441 [Willaertia magna]
MVERQLLEEEKQQWEKEKQLMKTLNPITSVYLNVGGRHFTTSITTLTTLSNSFFTTIFSGRFELSKTKDGYIFIDRDGDLFVYILEYLRDREIIFPNSDTSLLQQLKKKIIREANYYQLEELIDYLNDNKLNTTTETEIFQYIGSNEGKSNWSNPFMAQIVINYFKVLLQS